MEIQRIEPFLEYYEKVRQRTRRLLDLVPDDQWERSPIPGKFSFADLVRHLAAIERFMYAENVQGKPSLYRGCGKELADGKDQLYGFFDRCHRESMAIFASDEYTRRDPAYWATYRDRIGAVTAADVQRVAREHLPPEKMILLVVGKQAEIDLGDEKHPVTLVWLAPGGKVTTLPLRDPMTMKPLAP